MTISSGCGQCGLTARITLNDFDTVEAPQPAIWTCPSCALANSLPVFAKILQVERLDLSEAAPGGAEAG